MDITSFVNRNYRHFNAAVIRDAAKGWIELLANQGKMFLTMAGAMSTAEIGITLAELIRRDKIHGISCTGANLEEDIFNLVAHNCYERVPHYRSLSSSEEVALHARGMNRVTDTCIPEEEAIRKIEKKLLSLWQKADQAGESFFPHEFLYQLIRSGSLNADYQIDPNNSWMIAAAEKDLPIFTPGWEDSTTGNIFVAHCIMGDVKRYETVRSGPQQMASLVSWYQETTSRCPVGFFQIGGGIAGDFPIILGGEHSVSLGAIAACSRHYSDLSVLQFDAHTDLRESYEGNPYSHACIMKRALGLVRNITSIGIRSMDASEVETAKSVNIFQASELRSDIPLDRIVGTLSPNVYITLDLDVFDPSIMPATGTPEPGGLLWYETLSMLRAVFLKKNVVGCDIVELSPVPGAHAADFLAARLAYKLIAYKYFLKQ